MQDQREKQVIYSLAPPVRQAEGRVPIPPAKQPVAAANKNWKQDMLERRRQRKRGTKLQKINASRQQSQNAISRSEKELLALETKWANPQPPTEQKDVTWMRPSLPAPPKWKSQRTHQQHNPMCELINQVMEEELKQMVLEGKIETGIDDSGATSSCGK